MTSTKSFVWCCALLRRCAAKTLSPYPMCTSNLINSKQLLVPTSKIRERSYSMTDAGSTSFAKAFEEQEKIKEDLNLISTHKVPKEIDTKTASFATLLRYSPFISLGDFQGKQLYGRVVEVLDDNLFIDYGGKFLCVCKKPRDSPSDVGPGSTVQIKLLDWELSARFLGATKDITLLESEARIFKVEPKVSRKVKMHSDKGGYEFEYKED
ncbi:small ribosomal subunit protein bS1m-like isoform X1 [Styela clava]